MQYYTDLPLAIVQHIITTDEPLLALNNKGEEIVLYSVGDAVTWLPVTRWIEQGHARPMHRWNEATQTIVTIDAAAH